MIVVEGPDGAGKSTLVANITKTFGLEIGPRGTDNRDLLYTVTVPDTFYALSQAVAGHSKPFVWDRLFYSDFVYARIQSRPVAFSQDQMWFIRRVIDMLECPIILCYPPVETVIANVEGTHQMDKVTDNIRQIHKLYAHPNLFSQNPPPYVYDYTRDKLKDVLNYIEQYLASRSLRKCQ